MFKELDFVGRKIDERILWYVLNFCFSCILINALELVILSRSEVIHELAEE